LPSLQKLAFQQLYAMSRSYLQQQIHQQTGDLLRYGIESEYGLFNTPVESVMYQRPEHEIPDWFRTNQQLYPDALDHQYYGFIRQHVPFAIEQPRRIPVRQALLSRFTADPVPLITNQDNPVYADVLSRHPHIERLDRLRNLMEAQRAPGANLRDVPLEIGGQGRSGYDVRLFLSRQRDHSFLLRAHGTYPIHFDYLDFRTSFLERHPLPSPEIEAVLDQLELLHNHY